MNRTRTLITRRQLWLLQCVEAETADPTPELLRMGLVDVDNDARTPVITRAGAGLLTAARRMQPDPSQTILTIHHEA